eukprot:7391242-Pyramimonas_sp.AAC.1
MFYCSVHEAQEGEEQCPYPDDVLQVRKDIWEQGQTGAGAERDFATVDLLYALPMRPEFRPPEPSLLPVKEWGARDAPWPSKVFGDGSCFDSDFPEARRCGWAVVALAPNLLPFKA